MYTIFSTVGGKLKQIENIQETEKGVWVHAVSPTKEEIDVLSVNLNIEREFFTYPLDEDEHSRIDQEEEQTLIIANFPVPVEGGFDTYPLGIIMTDKVIVTVSSFEPQFFRDFASGRVKTFETFKKVRFVLQILYKISALYMLYLRQIGRKIDYAEEVLKVSTKNEELLKMLNINKSLIYLSTALRSNQVVLEKIQKIRYFRIYEEDLDLLEDTLIENRQGIEMSAIYSNILSGTMEAHASIISNNLNSVMKILTSATIVIMLPTFLATLYGMNVNLPFQDNPVAFIGIGIACIVITLIAIAFFNRRRFF